jgi:RimJ/RimL family protein N-acetyltransferase
VLTPDEKEVLVHVPEPLRKELTAALARTPLAVAFEDRRAVSFCYAHHVTETLWDVSVDTLERSRRRGHAVRAASCLIRRMRRLGKEPVWGAEDSNPGSRRAAERLGFVPAARFSLFRPS